MRMSRREDYKELNEIEEEEYLDPDGDTKEYGTEHSNVAEVYYISLVAADARGMPQGEKYVFDVASKLEMENTNVRAIDAQDLVKFYNDQQAVRGGFDPDTAATIVAVNDGGLNVYELVEFFVQANPNSCIIIDECPFISGRSCIPVDFQRHLLAIPYNFF